MADEVMQVPLLPLPKTVFFPNMLLRLHVSEGDHRQMAQECLEGEGRLAIAMLKQGGEKSNLSSPLVHRTMGLGRIVHHRELEDDKLEISVEGIARLRLLREVASEPWQIVEAEVLSGYSTPAEDSSHRIHQAFGQLLQTLDRMQLLLPQFKDACQKILVAHPHPGVVADLLANSFVVDAYDKQCILDELDVLRRIHLVNIQFQRIVENFSRAHYRDRL